VDRCWWLQAEPIRGLAVTDGANAAADRCYGPAAGEPPLVADPRRWGSLIGLAGGMTFIAAYSPVLGRVASAIAWTAGLAGVAAALFAHYIRPVGLGLVARPRRHALVTYGGCVVAEVALMGVGSRILISTGQTELRPALIAAVVGLHFLPFAWIFREPMFLCLGGSVAVLGVIGLVTGAFGVAHAASAMAVIAGLVMLAIVTIHAQGRFASTLPE